MIRVITSNITTEYRKTKGKGAFEMKTGKTARPILNRAYERHILNLSELAGRMGWAVSTASHKINDPKSMTLKEATRLCELTGFTLDELAKM